MAFGSKKDKIQAEIKDAKKKKNKKEKDDGTLAYENPAFEIYDPGSSFNAQSGFITQQPLADATPPAPTEPPTEPAPQNLISPEEIMQQLNPNQHQAIEILEPAPTEAEVAAMNQAAVDPNAIANAGVVDPNAQYAPPAAYDPNMPMDPNMAATGMVDPNAMVNQPGVVDPNAGLPPDQVDYNGMVGGGIETQQQQSGIPENQQILPGQEGREKVARPVKRFRYTIINGLGKKEKGTFEAEDENEVRQFLQSQDYQVLEVKERSKSDIDLGGPPKIGPSDLSFSLTQLSTYLRAGIPLSDSVRILAKQSRKANLKKSFSQLVYQLLKGENLSDAMLMQGSAFPKLLINMVKTAEMTGDLPSILDDMSEYYTSMDQTRKQMKSAMTYPAVVLTIAIGVLIFMLTYLVPQFTSMFEDQGAELPFLTQMIVGVSNFIKENWLFLIAGVLLVIFSFIMLYRKIQPFRKTIQIILMHMPVFKDIIIYNEMANFSKTFASLLNHSVFITDSMEILSKITENEVYKDIINKTLENLAKGDSISSAFRGQWAIPIVAYEMIVTGESTGQLGAMMEKVASHFQMLHKNVIDQMKSLVEPVMIVFLAGIVGVILVSIIQPMFSIYSQIK